MLRVLIFRRSRSSSILAAAVDANASGGISILGLPRRYGPEAAALLHARIEGSRHRMLDALSQAATVQ